MSLSPVLVPTGRYRLSVVPFSVINVFITKWSTVYSLANATGWLAIGLVYPRTVRTYKSWGRRNLASQTERSALGLVVVSRNPTRGCAGRSYTSDRSVVYQARS